MDKIIGVIPIYKPQNSEISNIERYIKDLDFCILMDDSGEDNSVLFRDLFRKYESKLEYILNEKNIGLCASVNRGFRISKKLGAKWILVMNPDGSFGNNAIKIYREFIKNNSTENVAIICPTYNIDRRPRVAKLGVKNVDYADMSGCLYNISILDKLGYYDQNTYFYGLDTEYCIRVVKYGYKIIECSEAVLNHNPAETRHFKVFGRIVFSYGFDSPVRFYYQFRSAKYIHDKYGITRQDFFMIYKIIKVLLFFENKMDYFRMIIKGIKDAKNKYYGPLIY